jgi:hypothetical protein
VANWQVPYPQILAFLVIYIALMNYEEFCDIIPCIAAVLYPLPTPKSIPTFLGRVRIEYKLPISLWAWRG